MNVDAIEDVRHETQLARNNEADTSIEGYSDPRENLLSKDDDKMEELYRMSREIQETACPSLWYALKSTTFIQLALMAFCLAIYNYFLLTACKDIYKSVLNYGDK